MTISSTTNRASFTGNGVTTSFSFPYFVIAASHLKVYQNGTLKTLTTHYTLSGSAPYTSGTNVQFVTAPASGDEIVILRDVPLTQLVDLVDNDPFDPDDAVERPLDQVTMALQRLSERVDRSFHLADSDVSGASTVIPEPEADTFLVWNSDGDALENASASDLVTIAGSANWTAQLFSGDGSTTTFTLSATPGGVDNLEVFVAGVRKRPTTDYTVSGTTLTFLSAPASGTNNILTRRGETLAVGVADSQNVNFVRAEAGAATTDLRTKLRQFNVSVADFASSTTITSSHIQAAIDAVFAAGGGVVQFPIVGYTYNIDAQVTVKPGVVLKGGDSLPENSYKAALPVLNVTVGSGATTVHAFLLRTSSGMSGFTFNYPNQVSSSSSSPTQYGYSIATDTVWAGSGNVDSILIENIFLYNPYYGISLDKAGRFSARNIHGQPIAKGIYIDRVYDIGRSNNIHFWTFHSTPGTNLHTWMRSNATAFDIGRVDGWHADDIFCYGYQYGAYFRNPSTNGSPWVLGSNWCMDVCSKPFYIDKAERVALSNVVASSDNGYAVGFDTGTDTGGVVQVSNYQAFGVGIGMVIRSISGRHMISNPYCKAENGTGQCDVGSVICTGQTPVFIDGIDSHSLVYGSSGVVINGVGLPSLDNDVTPAGFNTPDTWAVNAKCTSITNGSRFNLDTGVTTQAFSFGTGIKEAQGIYVLEFDIKFNGNLANTAASQFYFRIRDGSSNVYVLFPEVQTEVKFETTTRIRIPFLMDFGDTAEFVWGTTSGSSAGDSIDITNMKIWQQATYKSENAQIAVLRSKNNFLDPRSVGPLVQFNYGKKTLYLSAAPTAAPCGVGDRTVRNPPASGQPKAWVCTVAGSPGTHVSEGNL